MSLIIISQMEKSSKRKIDDVRSEESDVDKSPALAKPNCKYGSQCYRKNPSHLSEFRHDEPDTSASSSKHFKLSSAVESINSGRIYLTKVHGVPNSALINQDFSLSLKDILSLNQDDFVESAQFNYMHDIEWLIEQYPAKNRDKPLTIVHGSRTQDELGSVKKYSNVKVVKAKLDSPYGTHHTKMMLLLYKTGMRVVVHTANLIEQDWAQKTQGIWISDLMTPIGSASLESKKPVNPNAFDSKTNFKKYLIVYLESYNDKIINQWIEQIKKHDMSSANVFLIGSVPGRFPSTKQIFGHLRLRKVLSEHFKKTEESSSSGPDQLLGQFSSIGSLGANENNWLCKEFSASLSTAHESSLKSNRTATIKLIYPTVENVRTSYEGYSAGGSLPYSKNTAVKQAYLKNFLYKWKSDCCQRTLASPHIKSYARCSHDFDKIYWFLLTSANLSKAAWGNFEKNETQYLIRSIYLSDDLLRVFAKDHDKIYFNVHDKNQFLVPYDLPVEKYDSKDEPWVVDISYTDKEDSHGRLWRIL